jgi:catechol 2,3-dioxygenase-like lactoylglutathione lyase family enzyme
MQVNHLHLRVSDIARSREFYERFFGLREHVWHGDVLFMTDEARFDLALAPGDRDERFPPWFHFGFRLASGAHVRHLFDHLTRAGATIVQALEEHDDLVCFRCADPDGYVIEVYWE